MSAFKYICNTCNLTFDDAESASAHIQKFKHKKKVEENVLKDKKLPEQKKKILEQDFKDNKLVSEKDIHYGKMLKVNNDTNSRKYTYFFKFCNRQFVKKDSLLNHMNKTCKVKKIRKYLT